LLAHASCRPFGGPGGTVADRAWTPHFEGDDITLECRLTARCQTAQLFESLRDSDLRVERQGALPIGLRPVRIGCLKELACDPESTRGMARVVGEPVRGTKARPNESLLTIAMHSRGDFVLDEGKDLEAVAGLERERT